MLGNCSSKTQKVPHRAFSLRRSFCKTTHKSHRESYFFIYINIHAPQTFLFLFEITTRYENVYECLGFYVRKDFWNSECLLCYADEMLDNSSCVTNRKWINITLPKEIIYITKDDLCRAWLLNQNNENKYLSLIL